MQTFTDEFTHSDQGMGAAKGYLAHENEANQGHTYLCKTMQGGGPHIQSKVDMHTFTDEYTHTYKTHSNQGV